MLILNSILFFIWVCHAMHEGAHIIRLDPFEMVWNRLDILISNHEDDNENGDDDDHDAYDDDDEEYDRELWCVWVGTTQWSLKWDFRLGLFFISSSSSTAMIIIKMMIVM